MKVTKYEEYIEISIKYIRIFGKKNYIELYRKNAIDLFSSEYNEISDAMIPLDNYEYIQHCYVNVHTGKMSYYTFTIYGDGESLSENHYKLAKILKRLIRIHKLNSND